MKPIPVQMWAVVVKSKGSEWINCTTIARLKKDAWKKYEALWVEDYRDQCEQELKSGKVRLSKVMVSVA